MAHKCDLCASSFGNSFNLKAHKRIHTGEKPFKCDTCGGAFTQKHYLITHKRIHTGELPFKCDLCEGAFRHKAALNLHKRIHTGEKPYKCSLCEREFTRKQNLDYHMMVHTGALPFKCDLCEAAFRYKHGLNIHKTLHTGKRPFKCDLCEKTFRHKILLETHKTVHTGEKPFKCDLCESAFRQKGSLVVHRRIHTGERPLKCDVCDAAFKHRQSFITHKRIHTGEQPVEEIFICDLCKKVFKQKQGLLKHMRIHTGEMPFKCSLCEKAFRQKIHLEDHKRTHTEGKPFKCDLCEHAFSREDFLVEHKKIHTHINEIIAKVHLDQRDLTNHKTRRRDTEKSPIRCDVWPPVAPIFSKGQCVVTIASASLCKQPEDLTIASGPLYKGPEDLTIASGPLYKEPEDLTIASGSLYKGPEDLTIASGSLYKGPEDLTIASGPLYKGPEDLTIASGSLYKGPEDLTIASRSQYKGPEDLTIASGSLYKGPEDLTIASGSLYKGPEDLTIASGSLYKGPEDLTIASGSLYKGPEDLTIASGSLNKGPEDLTIASGSLYKQLEELTLKCDVCKYQDIKSPVISYCQVCTKALCQVCDKVHRIAQQTGHHKLLTGDQLLAVPSDTGRIPPIMMCDKHQLPLKYFCKNDNTVLCNTCKITSHRFCDISNLTTQAVRAGSQMPGKVHNQIKKYEQMYRQLKKKRTCDKNTLKTQIQKCLDDLVKSRKEINDVLDDLEKKMIAEIKRLEGKLAKEIDDHLVIADSTLDRILDSFNLMRESEFSKKDDIMFVTMKKVEENLREFESLTTGLEAELKDIRFEPSDLLTTELHNLNKFGNIIYQTPLLEMSVNAATYWETGSQKVHSIVFMPDGNIVMACFEDGLRLFDKDFILQSTMEMTAIGACRMSDTEVLVSGIGTLTLVGISTTMVKKKDIQVGRLCSGVDFYNKEIYVTCHNCPGNGEVRVLDLDGQVQRRLGSDGESYYMFEDPGDVKVSIHGDKVVVSDLVKHCVLCLDQLGQVLFCYSDVDLLAPTGILLDAYDNFLVCDFSSNAIHAVSKDGQKQKVLLNRKDLIYRPLCISYRGSDGCLAIGFHDDNGDNESLLTFRALGK